MKDITRINQPNNSTVGWYVRVRFHGKVYGRYFSDRKYDGKDLALAAAISWRDETRTKIGKPATDSTIHTVPRAANKTGVVGVSRDKKKNRYNVTWVTLDGKQGKTSVSIRQHGEQEAFSRACAIRKRKEEERYDHGL